MTVRDTSIDAFKQVDLSRQQRRVLIAISERYEACIADTAAWLGWQRSTVAARMNELAALGEIELVKDGDGKPVKIKREATGVAALHYRIKSRAGQQTFQFAGAVSGAVCG